MKQDKGSDGTTEPVESYGSPGVDTLWLDELKTYYMSDGETHWVVLDDQAKATILAKLEAVEREARVAGLLEADALFASDPNPDAVRPLSSSQKLKLMKYTVTLTQEDKK